MSVQSFFSGYRHVRCLVAIGVISIAAGSHGNPPIRVTGPEIDGVTPVELDAAGVAALSGVDEAIIEGFPVGAGLTLDLVVQRIEVFSPDAQIVAVGPEGEYELARPEIELLSGQVLGDEQSHVFLGFAGNVTNGYIRTGEHMYVLSSGRDVQGDGMVIYDLNALPDDAINWAPFECMADALPQPPVVAGIADGGNVRGAPCRIAEVAVETDFELRQIFGNETDAAAYVTLVMGAMSDIYTRDVNTRIQISYMRIWNSSNDPWNETGTVNQLFQFQDYWNANMTHIERSAAHFLSGRGLGGGVAYYPGLCQDEFDYGLSANLAGAFPYPLQDNHSQNWDPFVVSHELGHNFGAPHTHDMNPPADRCASGDCSAAPNGTIMSYCHGCPGGMVNIVLRMHERSISEAILPYLANGAPCDIECPSCPADFNGDGEVNTLDFIAYLNAFSAGDLAADFNGDGSVNTLDFLAFLNAFNAGC